MCGWVAEIGSARRAPRLRAALATLASRGPDGEGVRVIDEGPLPACLAHRRLAILDLTDSGRQPMYDPKSKISVVYNGEIYNAPSLRRELESRGAVFKSTTDTEVLLHGWAAWGDEGLLQRIEGMFSFALLDERRGRALLARDRTGIKPLYWARIGETVVAGSAPRSLIALQPELSESLDRVAIAQYLTLLWIPHPRTPWAQISKLPPAHAVSIRPDSVRTWRYWTPSPPDGNVSANELRERLSGAVQRQLLSDVPVGVMLSGGLDSTLIALLAERHYPKRIQALSAGFGAAARYEVNGDDLAFAREIARDHPQLDLIEAVLDQRDPWADLEVLAPHFDDPVADPAAITMYRLASASPTKVLLSGVGAEELLAGYPRHVRLRVARALARSQPHRLHLDKAARILWGGRPGLGYRTRRDLQKLTRALSTYSRPHYWRMMAQLSDGELHAFFPDEAATAVGELDAASTPIESTTLPDALQFDRDYFLPNLNLAYVDKAAMASSVEVRVPLLDEMVLATATRAEPRQLVAGRQGKQLLREAARGITPTAIAERPKTGFGAPHRYWLRAHSERFLEAACSLGEQGLVQPVPARRLVRDSVTGRVDSGLAAWALACLDAWSRVDFGRMEDERGRQVLLGS